MSVHDYVLKDGYLVHEKTGNKIFIRDDPAALRDAPGLLTNPRYYIGKAPTHCQMLGDPITDTFYDCKTTMGPWANVGQRYFEQGQCRTGTGLGQKYQLQENGQWLKTAG